MTTIFKVTCIKQMKNSKYLYCIEYIQKHFFVTTCVLDIALTALRSDPEQKVSAAPHTIRPLPSVQFSSWVTFSSRSSIILPEDSYFFIQSNKTAMQIDIICCIL